MGKLAQLVRHKLEIPCVRITGNIHRTVSYIGVAPGGLGQIFTYADEFADTNTEAIIFGEALAYSEIYTLESGYSSIATSHEVSEMPGMKKLASLL
jgi:putative NIF3 family GTP cyclohydrolase 1 type 2